jgi:hypothetical protein
MLGASAGAGAGASASCSSANQESSSIGEPVPKRKVASRTLFPLHDSRRQQKQKQNGKQKALLTKLIDVLCSEAIKQFHCPFDSPALDCLAEKGAAAARKSTFSAPPHSIGTSATSFS